MHLQRPARAWLIFPLLALALAAPLQAQLVSLYDFAAPPSISYVIGIQGRNSYILLTTVADAYEAPKTFSATGQIIKRLNASDFVEGVDQLSNTAVDPINPNNLIYTSVVAFAPAIATLLISPPNTFTFNPTSTSTVGVITFGADGSLYHFAGATGIQKYANSSYAAPTLSFATSGAGQLTVSSHGLAVTGNVAYALDLAGNRIMRYDSTTGSYLDNFAVTGAEADSRIAVSETGRLYLTTGNGGGNIYDATTGAALNTFLAGGSNPGSAGRDALYLDDATGYLYTFDSATGMHVFFDSAAISPIPEPGTYAGLAGTIALAAGLVRRRRQLAAG